MHKRLIQIVAFLLIPCLVVDPVIAGGLGLGMPARSISARAVLSTARFSEEAVVPAILGAAFCYSFDRIDAAKLFHAAGALLSQIQMFAHVPHTLTLPGFVPFIGIVVPMATLAFMKNERKAKRKKIVKPWDGESLEGQLVITLGSRALFDLKKEHNIAKKYGIPYYRKYQRDHEMDILKPGVAFPLIKKLLQFNKGHTSEDKLVEVVLVSQNDADAGIRIFNSIDHYRLGITRAAFTNGDSIYPSLDGFNSDLHLSGDMSAVIKAVDNGFAAAHMVPQEHQRYSSTDNILRIGMDFDGVIVNDKSERYYKKHDLERFKRHEARLFRVLIGPGPLHKFLLALLTLRDKATQEKSRMELELSLFTTRNSPALKRVIQILRNIRQGGLVFDKSFFLGGIRKTPFIEEPPQDIYFDDQEMHLEDLTVAKAHVPFGIANRELRAKLAAKSSKYGGAATVAGEVTEEQRDQIYAAIAEGLKSNPKPIFRVRNTSVYVLPEVSKFDEFLIAHAGIGGEVFETSDPAKQAVYFSPERYKLYLQLSNEAKLEFWRHEILGHLVNPSASEREVRASYPLERVQREAAYYLAQCVLADFTESTKLIDGAMKKVLTRSPMLSGDLKDIILILGGESGDVASRGDSTGVAVYRKEEALNRLRALWPRIESMKPTWMDEKEHKELIQNPIIEAGRILKNTPVAALDTAWWAVFPQGEQPGSIRVMATELQQESAKLKPMQPAEPPTTEPEQKAPPLAVEKPISHRASPNPKFLDRLMQAGIYMRLRLSNGMEYEGSIHTGRKTTGRKTAINDGLLGLTMPDQYPDLIFQPSEVVHVEYLLHPDHVVSDLEKDFIKQPVCVAMAEAIGLPPKNVAELLSDGLKEIPGKPGMLDWGLLLETIQAKMDMFLYKEFPGRVKTAAIRHHDEERSLEILFRGRREQLTSMLFQRQPRGIRWVYDGAGREPILSDKSESRVWMKDIFPDGNLFDLTAIPSGEFRKELKHRFAAANRKRWELREGELALALPPAASGDSNVSESVKQATARRAEARPEFLLQELRNFSFIDFLSSILHEDDLIVAKKIFDQMTTGAFTLSNLLGALAKAYPELKIMTAVYKDLRAVTAPNRQVNLLFVDQHRRLIFKNAGPHFKYAWFAVSDVAIHVLQPIGLERTTMSLAEALTKILAKEVTRVLPGLPGQSHHVARSTASAA